MEIIFSFNRSATRSSDVVVLEMAADMQKTIPEKMDNSPQEKKGSVAQLAAQLSLSDIVHITNGETVELLEKLEASELSKKQGYLPQISATKREVKP